jgi:hypothetical protein
MWEGCGVMNVAVLRGGCLLRVKKRKRIKKERYTSVNRGLKVKRGPVLFLLPLGGRSMGVTLSLGGNLTGVTTFNGSSSSSSSSSSASYLSCHSFILFILKF